MKREAMAIAALSWVVGCGDAQGLGSAESDVDVDVAGEALRGEPSWGERRPAASLTQLLMRRTVESGVEPATLEEAAHRLCDLQADGLGDNAQNGLDDADPDDGGWDWMLPIDAGEHSADASPENVYGATALGVWAGARANSAELRFFTAMLDAARGAGERPGVDSPPDFVYLALLAQHSGNAGFAELARQRYEARLAAAGGAQAAGEAIRDRRAAAGADGLIAYDLGWMVLAARALQDAFPAAGFGRDAVRYGKLVYDAMTVEPPLFDAADPSEPYATQGVAWAAVALRFSGVGRHHVARLSRELLERQLDEGAWGFNAVYPEPDIQSTAHAVTALSLLAPGFGRRCAAAAGADWLQQAQHPSGGWEYPPGQTTPLVDGEVTFSLALSPAAPRHCRWAAPAPATVGEADASLWQLSQRSSAGAERPVPGQPL